MQNVSFDRISVVVQGAVGPLTHETLKSLRAHMPGAEIVLATWKGTDTKGYDADRVVLCADPGCEPADRVHNVMNNVNRQIVSTRAGLRAVERPYAFKIRSDMRIVNTNFLQAFGRFDHVRSDECRVFEHRVVINNLYCADPRRAHFLFHISDWVQFGTTADLLRLWDIPLQSTTDARWFQNRPRPAVDPVPTWLFRFIPEQYIWKTCLERQGVEIPLDYYGDSNPAMRRLADLAFANNLVILDYDQYGIEFLKYDPYMWDYSAQMSHGLWRVLVRRHCGPIELSREAIRSLVRSDRKVLTLRRKLRKQGRRFAKPFEVAGRTTKALFHLVVDSTRLAVTVASLTWRAHRGRV